MPLPLGGWIPDVPTWPLSPLEDSGPRSEPRSPDVTFSAQSHCHLLPPGAKSGCCSLQEPRQTHKTSDSLCKARGLFFSHFLCLCFWAQAQKRTTMPSRLHLIRFSLVPACVNLCGSRICHRLVLICLLALWQLQMKLMCLFYDFISQKQFSHLQNRILWGLETVPMRWGHGGALWMVCVFLNFLPSPPVVGNRIGRYKTQWRPSGDCPSPPSHLHNMTCRIIQVP